jgi:N-carbamoyl-L-amino-acid hydrolase
MSDRADPALTVAYAVLAVNKEARQRGAHAGVGRLATHPGTAEAIADEVTAWIEARAPRAATIDELGAALAERITERAGRDGTTATLTAGVAAPAVAFHAGLCQRISARLGGASSAGTHVATVMAGQVPTAMLLVRNPTGVYDAPAERATDIDCAAGVAALAMVLADLAGDADLPTSEA